MQGQTRNLTAVMVVSVVAITVVAALLGPSAVLAKSDTQGERSLSYTRNLTTTAPPAAKFRETARDLASLREVTPRRATEIATRKVATATRTLNTVSTDSGTAISGAGTSELSQAQSLLAGYIAKYPILAGTTVSFGSTPGGHQAVAYYTVGRILINPNHTASLSRIIGHEIWHVIDYRDNGRIDWGENVPPSNYP